MSELGRDARAFLASARGAHAPPEGAKDRVRVGVAAALSAPAVTAGAGAGARTRWMTAAKLATLAVITGAGLAAMLAQRGDGGAVVRAPLSVEPAPAALSPRTPLLPAAPPPEARPAPPPAVAIVAAPSPPVVAPESLPVSPLPPPVPVSPPAPRVARGSREGSVAAEVAILRRVSVALRAGDPKSALAAVNEHARRFPGGALAEERDTERIVALCALGRRDEAARATERFVRAYPSSSHEARVRAACAPAPGATP